ncbi:MAG: UxaA family hydrolase, partial [Candidatus Geothermincolales bacterium]
LHGHGCGRGMPDVAMHFRALAGLLTNPNVAAAVVVGLGCEVVKAEALASQVASTGKPVAWLEIQAEGGSRKSAEKGRELARRFAEEAAKMEREEVPLSELVLGLECGGSDAFSGVTANPAVGLLSDYVVNGGGTVVLTEATEMIGTAHVLGRRACDPEVAKRVEEVIRGAERQVRELLGPLASMVIAPGNMDGGMSSIVEKSLGCIRKGGSSPVVEVVEYGQAPTRRGLVIMDGPGYDVESMAGLAASGCQAIVFTTGRGNPVGFPIVPVIKVASNPRLFHGMRDDMDVNAGAVLEGVPLEQVAEELKEVLHRTLDGEPTRAEMNRQGGILCLYSTTPSF